MTTTWDVITQLWELQPSVLTGCLLLLAGYLWLTHGEPRSKSLLFAAGDAVLAFALVSPLDLLGDDYLFSAHMLQHLLIMLVAAPMMVAGLPASLVERAQQHTFLARAMDVLGNPVLDWFIMALILWGWHAPVLYNAALASEGVHILEHLMMLAAGLMFFWPILNPLPERRIQPLAVVPYAFTGAISNSILGILLTFTPVGLYPAYVNPTDEIGILKLIRQGWGLTAEIDQQVGGLLMWVPGGLVFLSMVLVGLTRWYAEEGKLEDEMFLAPEEAGTD
ncbi:MAG: cytochrome c oxidase assembly protein [Anaerolineales bacterium]|jgi:cytochrome c oxidase assembly factor CtaG